MKIIPPSKCYVTQFIRQRGKVIKASLVNQLCFMSANFSLLVFCWVFNSESLEEQLARRQIKLIDNEGNFLRVYVYVESKKKDEYVRVCTYRSFAK